MRVHNPRFPHTCKIWRVATSSPLVDEPADYDPMADEEDVLSPETEESEVTMNIIYEGECRAYSKNTTSDRGEVITSYRGLALPITQDEWTALGFAPQEGDLLWVERSGYREYGSVIDKLPANFGGTHLTWRYGRE